MKTIGLIAATSVAGALNYFEVINKTVNHALGGQHSARCVTYHPDFEEIEQALAAGRWDILREIVVSAAVTLEEAGADFLVLCSNALHKLMPELKAAVHIPVLHVVEVVADELAESEIQTVGVVGTIYAMNGDYYRDILDRRGIRVITPSQQDMELIQQIIFDELCHGIVREKSKREYLRIIEDMYGRGAEGVVLACTEIGMLVDQADTDVPLFDAAIIHGEQAAKRALE